MIVARGLGRPRRGSIVAEGLSAGVASGGPIIRFISATLTGSGSLTADLSFVNTATPVQRGGGALRRAHWEEREREKLRQAEEDVLLRLGVI
jgi:hypothetical protein